MHTEQQSTEKRDGRDNSSEMTPRHSFEEPAAIPPTTASTGVGEGGGRAAAGGSGSAGEGEAAGEMPSTEQTQWLIMSKNRQASMCTELASQLASTREELSKRDTRFAKER